jgi:hypothetical protein
METAGWRLPSLFPRKDSLNFSTGSHYTHGEMGVCFLPN